MKPYRTIIIDDERRIREGLGMMVKQYCPDIELVATAASAAEGRELLNSHQVDFIFLDISMPNEDGFAFLSTIPKENYGIIFVTAHQEYALSALKINAIDYLLKPVNPTELQEAVTKAIHYHDLRRNMTGVKKAYRESLNSFSETIKSGNKPPSTITVADHSGFRAISVTDIIYLEADNDCTFVHMAGLIKISATPTLRDFERTLGTDFFRINKSILVNLSYLNTYYRTKGSFVELKDGTTLSVSTSRLNEFREAVKRHSKSVR